MTIQELNKELGNIDIYLLDQILKGRYPKKTRILDAGCGEGRNIIYFLNNGYEVFGIDENPDAIRMLHFILGSKYPTIPKERFSIGSVDSMPFNNSTFDLVISSAVMHFAKDHQHFEAIFSEHVRVLKRSGQFFIRMTSDIGLNNLTPEDDYGRFHLPDGSMRYLITEKVIQELMEKHNLEFIEPIKTTNVNNQRHMTTLVFRKN
ncbi:MAG: class I SAM-dependent methyltransferase [Cyclobacteriaceae bacterium]